MTKYLKQESNSTGLSLAREATLGVLPAVPTFIPREPNSYKDFGADYKLKARSPINAGRQQQKGVIVDLDSSGGWQEDMTYDSLLNVADAILFAAYRTKSELAVASVTAAGGYHPAAGGNGYKAGDILFAKGFVLAANNGLKLVTANGDATDVMVAGLADEPVTAGIVSKVGRQFTAGDVSLTVVNGVVSLVSAADGFDSFGLIPGETIFIGDDAVGSTFANATSNGFARVGTVSQDGKTVTLDKMQFGAVADAGAGKSIRIYVGRVLKNESNPDLITRTTFTVERTLGKSDTDSPHQQAEYIQGSLINQWQIPLNTADKITHDFTLVGSGYTARDSTLGPIVGNRPVIAEGDAYTTSNDMVYNALHVVGDAEPLFTYLTDFSITVNNNIKPNKALGKLGAFDVSAGNFVVTATANAYFGDVASQLAISQNLNVTAGFALVRNNRGVVFDLPLITLGDGRPKIAANEPITLALSIEAASGSAISPLTDYTLMLVFFDYLPTVAGL